MKHTLQLLSMMNDTQTKRGMRLISFAGCFFAVAAYCAADESNRISGLALVSYFIFLIQLMQMNQGVLSKDHSGLELLYQTNRKKEILKYGIFLYNMLTLWIYLLFAWLCVAGFSCFKEVGLAYIPLSFVIVITSFFTTLLLLFQAHGYDKACNICSILFMIIFLSAVILSFDILPIRLHIPAFLQSLSTLPYIIMIIVLAWLALLGINRYLYEKNKGLRINKRR